MKRISLYTTVIGLALISSLSSCLKDDSQPDFTQNQPIIELPVGSSAGNGGGNSIAASTPAGTAAADYFIYVNYAAPEANPSDVTVTLAVSEAALTKFNQVNGTAYPILPIAAYTLTSNKVVIPTGQRQVKFPVKINTTMLDPKIKYALPFSITDGGGFTVSGNFGTLISIITLTSQ
ncbi:DUF1735 domain-containing protein [Pedobacter hartonius]|uniref:BT-3987-like N-terminal domain-containing protein n=1 Tax=Pedobacter hartonius TaxID=425514 RepID=A0A1H4EXR8_9SPHI|nr:DUF1735 domain-containing protein [Pedobacter hartonius]SEA89791.1 protein of unknown function [Pedobacter hartonius]